MTHPRSRLIDLAATPYYHCTSRCVRRAFLCGKDDRTGFDFEHRRGWIEARLQHLASVFAIDVCAYAVMSNHYHVILCVSIESEHQWSDEDVVARWRRIYRIPEGFELFDARRRARQLETWRGRLTSISWFMRCMNEPLARLANREDECSGRFWEGRFRSQALLDEESVLKCMAYVDLNPMRARLAETLEGSDYTSIQARLEGRASQLLPFADQVTRSTPSIPVAKIDYFALVETTGRQLRNDQDGSAVACLPPIIVRLSRCNTRPWVEEMRRLTSHYSRAIGSRTSLSRYRDYLGQTRLNGLAG